MRCELCVCVCVLTRVACVRGVCSVRLGRPHAAVGGADTIPGFFSALFMRAREGPVHALSGRTRRPHAATLRRGVVRMCYDLCVVDAAR